MIEKLYNLKKTQTDQRLIQKAQLELKIEQINIEISLTQNKIDTASVEKFGAISDFTILTMHKNTMKQHIQKLNIEKNNLLMQIENLIKQILELQKETEQFGYILDEEKKEKLRILLLAEQEAADEYIQSKYIKGE
uniref:hypothetical protein n=1 Tax=Aliarcobacter sp. TaxID=2321116 RepID=UPI004048AF30